MSTLDEVSYRKAGQWDVMRLQFFGGPRELHGHWRSVQAPPAQTMIVRLNLHDSGGVVLERKSLHYELGPVGEFDFGYFFVREIDEDELPLED